MLQRNLGKGIKIFQKKEKIISENMVANDIKILLRMKKERWLSIKQNKKFRKNKTASQINMDWCFLFWLAAIKRTFCSYAIFLQNEHIKVFFYLKIFLVISGDFWCFGKYKIFLDFCVLVNTRNCLDFE